MPGKEYRSERISVSFDPERCIHARYCVWGLPEVFNLSERPWVNPERANVGRVAEVVMPYRGPAIRAYGRRRYRTYTLLRRTPSPSASTVRCTSGATST
jgi:uncharacterized Fe-S cluster protein YjdI